MDVFSSEFKKIRAGGNVLQIHTIEEYETEGEFIDFVDTEETIEGIPETVFCISTGIPTIELGINKSILSFYDSEQAVLTATVLNSQGQPLEGITVTFYKGETSMGTSTTDSTGVATLTYTSTGAGDIVFKAEAETVQSSTITIKDCYIYDELTTDKNHYTLTQGNGTFVFANTGLTVTGTVNSDTFWYAPDDFLPANDYTVEVDYVDWSSSGFGADFGIEDIFIGIVPSSNELTVYRKNGSALTVLRNFNYTKGKSFKFEVTGTTSKTIAIYYDNTLIYTASNITQTRKQFFKTYNGRMTEFKNLKIY